MTKIIYTLIVFLMMTTTIEAQTADEKAVAEAVEQLRKAMVGADIPKLKSLAADEISYGHSNGLIENKAQFVDQFVTGTSVFKTINLSDQTVKIFGDVAIVRHRLTGDTNNSNVPGKVDLMVLLVWQKQKGTWKLLARQAVKNPPKA
jgi:ketosteroid isomerase-like protein